MGNFRGRFRRMWGVCVEGSHMGGRKPHEIEMINIREEVVVVGRWEDLGRMSCERKGGRS